jgi:hypothetical protein
LSSRRERRPDNRSAREGIQSISLFSISVCDICPNIFIFTFRTTIFTALAIAPLKISPETLSELQPRP